MLRRASRYKYPDRHTEAPESSNMAPAAHDGQFPHHRRALTVTNVQHQGAHDDTSVWEIAPTRIRTCPHSVLSGKSLSLSPTPCTVIAVTPISTTPTLQSTTSNYPRPSPPTFLYPAPIVPPHVYEYTMQRDIQEHSAKPLHHPLARDQHDQTSDMPTWLAVFVFAVIAIAGTWSIAVCLIHWRGATTGMVTQRRLGQERGGGRCAWLHGMNLFARKTRYEALHSGEEKEEYTAALASAHDVFSETECGGRGAQSPLNPFLVPLDQPLRRGGMVRGSSEWAEEHRAFFSSTSHSPQSGSSCSLSGAELDDIESEAREAQGRRSSLAHDLERRGLDDRASRSWVDLGLAVVDDAVDRVAAKIVRWTDDGGRDEELVLPLARGKQN